MKYKTTRKAIVNGTPSNSLFYTEYCELSYLLRNHEPVAYTCGVYGWNFDVYEVYGLTICTGYRGMPGKRLEHIAEYEDKAKAIINDWETYKGNYEAKKEAIEALLYEFCKLNGGY